MRRRRSGGEPLDGPPASSSAGRFSPAIVAHSESKETGTPRIQRKGMRRVTSTRRASEYLWRSARNRRVSSRKTNGRVRSSSPTTPCHVRRETAPLLDGQLPGENRTNRGQATITASPRARDGKERAHKRSEPEHSAAPGVPTHVRALTGWHLGFSLRRKATSPQNQPSCSGNHAVHSKGSIRRIEK